MFVYIDNILHYKDVHLEVVTKRTIRPRYMKYKQAFHLLKSTLLFVHHIYWSPGNQSHTVLYSMYRYIPFDLSNVI